MLSIIVLPAVQAGAALAYRPASICPRAALAAVAGERMPQQSSLLRLHWLLELSKVRGRH